MKTRIFTIITIATLVASFVWFDNHPACVSVDTAAKLMERNWGYVPPNSQAYEDLGDKRFKENEN